MFWMRMRRSVAGTPSARVAITLSSVRASEAYSRAEDAWVNGAPANAAKKEALSWEGGAAAGMRAVPGEVAYGNQKAAGRSERVAVGVGGAKMKSDTRPESAQGGPRGPGGDGGAAARTPEGTRRDTVGAVVMNEETQWAGNDHEKPRWCTVWGCRAYGAPPVEATDESASQSRMRYGEVAA